MVLNWVIIVGTYKMWYRVHYEIYMYIYIIKDKGACVPYIW